MKRLNRLTIERDGCAIANFEEVRTHDFQLAQQAAFERLAPGENASNKLRRAIGWAVYAQDRFTWLDRETYQLSKQFNPEEGGRVRRFPPIDRNFVERADMEAILRKCFAQWNFAEPTSHRAYELQCSYIRYEPTIEEPAFPAPIAPHQDMIDGVIVVLHKRGDLTGGLSRIYGLDNEPLIELDLAVGEGLVVKDDRVKHQVTTLQLEPGRSWRPGDRAYRDIMIVRFQPVGR